MLLSSYKYAAIFPAALILALAPILRAADTSTTADKIRYKHWTVSQPVFKPGAPGAFDEVAVKDPTIVQYNGAWHMFYTSKPRVGSMDYKTALGYATAPTIEGLCDAKRTEMLDILGDSMIAPQVFYFEPQKLWYLIGHVSLGKSRAPGSNLQPVYSTNPDITNVNGWSKIREIKTNRQCKRIWIDFWVICDDDKAHFFYSDHTDILYRMECPLTTFPEGLATATEQVALRSNGTGKKGQWNFHEAAHIYRVKSDGKYIAILEGGYSHPRRPDFVGARDARNRFMYAYTADRLEGPWRRAESGADDFLGDPDNLYNPDGTRCTRYTQVSHPELLRSGHNQRLEVENYNFTFLFQGFDGTKFPDSYDYQELPWELALMRNQTAASTTALQARLDEIAVKETRIRALLDASGLDGVLLATQRNFAWATAGSANHVAFNTEEGAASLLWVGGKKYLVTGNNEIDRFAAEEIAGLGYEHVVFNWFDESAGGARAATIQRIVGNRKIGADVNFPGAKPLATDIDSLRQTLTDGELSRYRTLGRITAEIVEQTCREITPGETEKQIQGRLLGRLYARGIAPSVVLIAADERFVNYKHPIPKNTPVRRCVSVSVCAKKWGLTAAVTRTVHFGPLPPEIAQRQDALVSIYTQMLRATRPGAPAVDVFEAARAAYARTGNPDGWQAHHLGGPTGYREREYRIHPGCPQIIQSTQAFAWNPTLPGTKIEETFIVHSGRLEFLTQTGDWPCATADINGRQVKIPLILQLRHP